MIDIFEEGRKLCIENASSHLDMANVLLDGDRRGAAVSHALLAYEEAAKAVYCAMVASGLVDSEEISSIFRSHEQKAVLFHELFGKGIRIMPNGSHRTVIIQEGRIEATVLKSLARRHQRILRKHNTKRNRGFYVDFRNGNWLTPDDTPLERAQEEMKENRARTFGLIAVSNIIVGLRPGETIIDNFQIQNVSEKNGGIAISYDEY
ncbi:MAG: AbiV family abortive infection protein [Thermoplasmata archaeon]|nr:AbiV family abortive infection protein [Thermoplasmata archaeon]